MKTLKYIYENLLVILSVIYLWVLPIAGYKGFDIKPYHIAFSILALGIYISDRTSKK